MKYELLCETKLKRKWINKTNVEPIITILVEIYDYNGNNYGNGKGLEIQIGDDTPELFDIRYDVLYNIMNEIKYVKQFVYNYARTYLIFDVVKIMEVKTYE